MKVSLCTVAVVCLSIAAAPPKGKLDGTWTATSIKYDNEEMVGDTVKNLKITVAGDKLSVSGEAPELERYGKFTIKLDPKAKPESLDLTLLIGADKGLTMVGICKVTGDELHLCIVLTGKDRPKEFKSEEGSNTVLAVFKRDKEK